MPAFFDDCRGPNLTTTDVLNHLRDEHFALLEDVANGDRVFWVGSGISLNIAPMLPELIRNIFLFLQTNIEPGADDDPHLVTLRGLVVRFMPLERDSFDGGPIDWSIPPVEIFAPLANSYSEILAARVAGKAPDYILWTAADIPNAFGDPAILPGENHKLLAVLILEGVVTEIASGNWDGLIERAVSTLHGHRASSLSVMMTNDSFRNEHGKARLYKFHGCAVKALDSPSEFRPYLVGRAADIAGWAREPRYASVSGRMESLARTNPTLFVGLSVQDYDLMLTLIGAGVIHPWPWDTDHPAYLFTEQELSSAQTGLLEKVYPTEYAVHAADIDQRSTLGVYSLDALAAITSHVVTEKIKVLGTQSRIFATDAMRTASVAEGVRGVEIEILRAGGDASNLLDVLIDGLSSTVKVFMGGLPADSYQPLFEGTARQAHLSDQPVRDRSVELAAVLAILGLGVTRRRWRMTFPTDETKRGLLDISLPDPQNDLSLAIVRDAAAADQVMKSATWTDGAHRIALVHVSGSSAEAQSRSSARGLGSGRVRPHRQFHWIDDSVTGLPDAESMLSKFAEEIGV